MGRIRFYIKISLQAYLSVHQRHLRRLVSSCYKCYVMMNLMAWIVKTDAVSYQMNILGISLYYSESCSFNQPFFILDMSIYFCHHHHHTISPLMFRQRLELGLSLSWALILIPHFMYLL